MALIIPKNNADAQTLDATLEVYYNAQNWVDNETLIDKLSDSLIALGIENEKKEPQSYTKKTQVLAYFGFITWEDLTNNQSRRKITKLGTEFYEARLNDDQMAVVDILIRALSSQTFGRNVIGCDSDSDVEAPNVFVKAAMLLDGITNKQFAYILGQMELEHKEFSEAILQLKMEKQGYATTKLREDAKKWADPKPITALKNWGLIDSSTGCIPEDIIRTYGKELAELRVKNTDSVQFQSPSEEEPTSTPQEHLQIIYYGAPGTGKSQGIKGKSNTVRTTFHPDTDYASFVGCYKPTMEDGEIKYSFSPQAFFDAYVAAWNNPTKEHNLLIEEINRGNCAQIFGDLFQLLDRDDYGYSDYPIKADTDMWNELSKVLPANYIEFLTDYYKESQGEGFSGEGKIALPPNLSIIATMNTSDNSLYKMDSAFKRRWAWEYIAIDYKEEKLKDVVLDFADAPNNKWLPILERINKFIKENTGSTSKQIGQWFVKPQKNEANKYTTITLNTFVNKVMFFLFNDVFKDRDELKSLFGKDDEEFLFEDLVTLPGSQKTELLKTFIKNLPEIEAR